MTLPIPAPLRHAAILTEHIETWREYLDHDEGRARLNGLRVIQLEVNKLIALEERTVAQEATL